MYTNHEQHHNTAFSKLNEKQRRAVEAIDGPVLCVAGPGAGKSSVLSIRVSHILKERDVSPGNILCLTFTNSGVKSMKNKLFNLLGDTADDINVFTYHAFSNHLIGGNSSAQWSEKRLITETERFLLIEELAYKYPQEDKISKSKPPSGISLRSYGKIFSLFKQEGIDRGQLENYAHGCIYKILPFDERYVLKNGKGFNKNGLTKVEDIKSFVTRIYSMYVEYCERLKANNWIEYEDMLEEAVLLLDQNPDLLKNLQEKYSYILVDEFQDTNKKQLALLDKLVSGNELPNLFVVGDEDQCIYKFQGASHWNFEWMKRKFMDRLKTVVLNVNYRSTNLLVQETHNLICANSNRHILKKDPMIAGNDSTGSLPALTPTYKSFENAEQEAYSIAKSIKSQIDLGKRPSEIAVLVRRHSDTTAIKKWLIKLGISWKDNQNEKNLHETKYGKSLFFLLQFIRLQGKRGHFADSFLLQFLLLKQSPKHVIKSYLLYYGTQDKDFFQWLCSNPNELENFSTIKSGIITLLNSRHNKLSDDILHTINQIAEVGLSELPTPSEKNTWDKYIKEFCNNYKNTLQRLTEIMWYEYNYDIKTSIETDEKIENKNDVIISTIHASKGLEYEVVYLISCHQNNWENRDKKGGLKIPSPIDQFIAPEKDDYEDMRRLIYVACTRAKLELHVSSFRKYPAGGPLSTTTLLNNFGEKSQIQLENVENFELPDLSGEKYVLSPSSDLKDLVKSKLDSFQISSTSLNTWLVCQNQFFYTQVLKLSDINNQSGLFGTIVHNILQKYAEDENRQPTSAYLSNLIEQEFDKRDALFYPSHILWYKQFAMDLILNYLTKHPITTTPDYCEGNFTTILPTGVKLKGKIDRIDRAGNSLLVYDYKTSSTSKSLKPFEDINNPGEDYWRQAMIYTLLLNANFQNANQVNIAFHYLNDRLEQKKFEYNPNDSFLGWLSDIWGSIQNKEFTKNCNNPGCIYCSINL